MGREVLGVATLDVLSATWATGSYDWGGLGREFGKREVRVCKTFALTRQGWQARQYSMTIGRSLRLVHTRCEHRRGRRGLRPLG